MRTGGDSGLLLLVQIASDKPTGPGLAPGLPFGGGDPLSVDLSDKASAAALNRLLDEIAVIV
jgi:hypothetical protein